MIQIEDARFLHACMCNISKIHGWIADMHIADVNQRESDTLF